MRVIVITADTPQVNEVARIVSMLDSGFAWRVHLRKPDYDENQTASLIGSIPQRLYPKITLHDHHNLASKYELGGIHLNGRNPSKPKCFAGLVSKSCHSFSELESSTADYNFLSPVFDSISKTGYLGKFALDSLRKSNAIQSNTFALGGVRSHHLPLLAEAGFGGAAMLGEIWDKYGKLMDNFKLQLITDGLNGVADAIDGGCRWIQLRMKDSTTDDIIRTGREIRELCNKFQATFIIDDHAELVEALGADGVHLGKDDMRVDDARKLLGHNKIIGATANTVEDIRKAASLGADYVGLGPFRFTTTKKKLSPVLGIEGYSKIIGCCREEGIGLPIVAIGGIKAEDVKEIMATGADGVAVSGAILNNANITAETRKFINSLSIYTLSWKN